MNPRTFDLILRSVTTAILALGILAAAAYELIHTGSVDSQFAGFVGLVLGFYFGAHVAANGISQGSRSAQLSAAEAAGVEPAPDQYAKLPKPAQPRGK